MAEVSFALLCPSRTAESHSQIVVSTLLFRNLIARGAGSLRPSSGCKCFGLDVTRPILGVCFFSQPFQ